MTTDEAWQIALGNPHSKCIFCEFIKDNMANTPQARLLVRMHLRQKHGWQQEISP